MRPKKKREKIAGQVVLQNLGPPCPFMCVRSCNEIVFVLYNANWNAHILSNNNKKYNNVHNIW